MKDFNPAFTLGAGPDRSLNQPENNLLDEEGKRRYQSIVGATMYLAHQFPPWNGPDIRVNVSPTRGSICCGSRSIFKIFDMRKIAFLIKGFFWWT